MRESFLGLERGGDIDHMAFLQCSVVQFEQGGIGGWGLFLQLKEPNLGHQSSWIGGYLALPNIIMMAFENVLVHQVRISDHHFHCDYATDFARNSAII